MRQQDKESTWGISERLDSVLLNLKLVGGNTHPKELQSKIKVINPLRLDKDTAISVEYNIAGALLINSERD